jgi:uncharacterized membrane protein
MSEKALIKAGIVLGLGFGGFADGIMLHQILGWHHVVCSTPDCQPFSVRQLEHQNTQDGFFLLITWIISLTGMVMLFRAARHQVSGWSGRVLSGAMLAGWGLFNFFEGLINHQILGLHHVLPGNHQLLWDMLYLVLGLVFIYAGLHLTRSRHEQLLLERSSGTFQMRSPFLRWVTSTSAKLTH